MKRFFWILTAFLIGGMYSLFLTNSKSFAKTDKRNLSKKEERAFLENEKNTISIFKKVSPSVAFISTSAYRSNFFTYNPVAVPQGNGSGFIWDKNGHIVTNYHVIEGANAGIEVTLASGETYKATLIGQDPYKDLAVIKIKAPKKLLVPIKTTRTGALKVGQKAIAIGNPFGLDFTLTEGVISALDREIVSPNGTKIKNVIQTDASINPGNSGGPLVNSEGRLIGVNTQIQTTSGSSAGIGFAVPTSAVKKSVPELIQYKNVRILGLGIETISDKWARRYQVEGIIIEKVIPGLGAHKAGLKGVTINKFNNQMKLGDIITHVDNQRVKNLSQLFNYLENKKPGDIVIVQINRNGKELRAKVELMYIT